MTDDEKSIEEMAEVLEAMGWDYAESSDGTGQMFLYWDHLNGDMPEWADGFTSCADLESVYGKYINHKDKQLGTRVVKAFSNIFPDAWKHDAYPGKEKYECGKCDKTWPFKGNDPLTIDKWKCTVPTPVDVNDWNVAMMLVREVPYTHVLGQLEGIWELYIINHDLDLGFERWNIYYAASTDYTIAACIAKEATT